MTPRQALALAQVPDWIDSLAYWGEMLNRDDDMTILGPIRDVEMYLQGVERACAMLDDLFDRLDGAE